MAYRETQLLADGQAQEEVLSYDEHAVSPCICRPSHTAMDASTSALVGQDL